MCRQLAHQIDSWPSPIGTSKKKAKKVGLCESCCHGRIEPVVSAMPTDEGAGGEGEAVAVVEQPTLEVGTFVVFASALCKWIVDFR